MNKLLRCTALLACSALSPPAPVVAQLPGLSSEALSETLTRRLPFLCQHVVVQAFPVGGPAETTWIICWREVASNNSLNNPNGLVIGPAYFRRSPTSAFVRILWDMRVSDYFVPYHAGTPRFYDLSGFNFVLTGVGPADCPAAVGGSVVSPHVCKEVHDRGLLWKDWSGVKRGQEVVLWGAIDAANYRYIQEYTFRDDGVIIGRVGATGRNLPGDELEPHVHNAIWRIDIDLNGVTNSVAHVQHVENPVDASGIGLDQVIPIPTAVGLEWSARTHDAIEITNPTTKNRQGHTISYHLLPLVTGGGLTQHFEDFTHADFWVTPYNPLQFAARNLISYITPHAPVANRDLVVWYKGSLHHHPRDEDGVYDAHHVWMGTADAMWTGFMLMPHNFFDCSPLYRPCP